MNTRLHQFLSAENLTQAQFADSINVAPAGVSHVLAGRNKPGYDFLYNMMLHYPSLNIEWLLTGRGKMYKGQDAPEKQPATQENPSLFDMEDEQEQAAPAVSKPVSEAPLPHSVPVSAPQISPSGARRASKVIVFYDDGTFQEL